MKRTKKQDVPDYDFDADIETPAADIAAMYAEGRDYAAQEQAREEDARRAYERAELLAARQDYSQVKRDFKEWLTATGTDIVDFIHDQGLPLHSSTAERYAAMAGFHQITWSNNVTRRAKDAARTFKRGGKAARQATIMQAQAAPVGDYLDSSVDGTEPLEPYMPQTALLARLTRYAQNAVAVVAAAVPVLALAGCIYRSAVERQGTPEPEPRQPLTEMRDFADRLHDWGSKVQTTPHLIETRGVTNYVPPFILTTTKGDTSCNNPRLGSAAAPMTIPQAAIFTTRAYRMPSRYTGALIGSASRSSTSATYTRHWKRHRPTLKRRSLTCSVRYTSARAAKVSHCRHKARSGHHSARNHHHKRLHRLQRPTTRLDRAIPAIRAGAHTVIIRFAQLGPLE